MDGHSIETIYDEAGRLLTTIEGSFRFELFVAPSHFCHQIGSDRSNRSELEVFISSRIPADSRIRGSSPANVWAAKRFTSFLGSVVPLPLPRQILHSMGLRFANVVAHKTDVLAASLRGFSGRTGRSSPGSAVSGNQ